MPYADKNDPRAVECRRKSSRKYYDANREREIARCAAYNKANKEYVNARAVVRRSQKLSPAQVLFNNAKNRAKAQDIPFDISVEDIKVPTHCPILGIELQVNTGCAKDNSPSIDKIIPALGYVRGNIQIISHKANSMKNNATFEDIEKLYFFMKGLQNG